MKKFIGFFLYLFSRLIGRDINNENKTKGKRFLSFAGCSKFLLTMGTDEETVKAEIIDVLDILDETYRIDEFRFLRASKFTITIPPTHISFHDFNELIQFLTDEVNTVGLVEGDGLAFTVYEDRDTTNLIGQTDQGEKFFISLVDDFDKKQFLRLNDEIALLEEYSVSRIKSDLGESAIHS